MSLEILADTSLNNWSLEEDSSFSELNNCNKSFKCPATECGREFNSKRNLVDHVRGHHTGSKPHVCDFPGCGKSFLRPAHLVIHSRIHTGEKPFACDQCGKRWNQKSALKQHMRSHTGGKPFLCTADGCTKSFSTSSSCKRHIATHSTSKPSSPLSSPPSSAPGTPPSCSDFNMSMEPTFTVTLKRKCGMYSSSDEEEFEKPAFKKFYSTCKNEEMEMGHTFSGRVHALRPELAMCADMATKMTLNFILN